MADISASGAGNRAREGSLFKKTVLPNSEIYLHVATGANGLGVVSPLDWAEA